jgi:hypothetical protein
LPFGVDELDDELPSIDALTKKVKLHIYVLASVVENWILCQRNCWLIVHLECRRLDLGSGELCQQPPQPDHLACRRGCCDILRSHVDSATIFCFKDCQATGDDPRKTRTPEVLRRPSTSPAMSASLKTVSAASSEALGGASLNTESWMPPRLGKTMPNSVVPWT